MRPGPAGAVRGRPILVIVCAAIGVLAGLAFGLVRTPSYTAESRTQVQLSASNPAGLQGSLSAGIDFASTYARAIGAPEIAAQVAEETGLEPGEVESRISADPVPDTSVIDVTASADSAAEAEQLADAAAEALVDYSEREPDPGSNPSSDALLRIYEDAARDAERLGLDEAEARDDFAADQSPETRQNLLDTAVEARAAEAQRDAAQTAYVASETVFTAPLEIVTPAYEATSDRASMLQLLVVLGLVGGLLVGLALAVLRPSGAAKQSDDG